MNLFHLHELKASANVEGGLQNPPLSETPPENQAAPKEPAPEAAPTPEQEAPATPDNEQNKTEHAINAVEKLQAAAAAIDAAAFAIESDYSDFSLAEYLAKVKEGLIYVIGKTKDHLKKSGKKDPNAHKEVEAWLDQ